MHVARESAPLEWGLEVGIPQVFGLTGPVPCGVRIEGEESDLNKHIRMCERVTLIHTYVCVRE